MFILNVPLLLQCALPIRVMLNLGIKLLFVTNAAGAINKSFKVGDMMVIQDHIGLPLLNGLNPLVGDNDERYVFLIFHIYFLEGTVHVSYFSCLILLRRAALWHMLIFLESSDENINYSLKI